jgi:hypothetical protein
MKIRFVSLGEAQGFPQPGRTHPEGYAFCPPERGFSREFFIPPGATTEDENDSPPMEGCRGGWFQTGRTHPEGYAFCPSREGICKGVLHTRGTSTEDENYSPPMEGCRVNKREGPTPEG